MKSGIKKIENYDNKTNFDWNKDYKKRPFLEKVAIWGSYYRANPVMFVKDYFPELKLKLFQMIIVHMTFMSDTALVIACRGIGKSFVIALVIILRAILYPNSKIIVATSVKSMSRVLVQSKIQNELMRMCPNIRNEIEDVKISNHQCEVIFKNGSTIVATNTSENVRGY